MKVRKVTHLLEAHAVDVVAEHGVAVVHLAGAGVVDLSQVGKFDLDLLVAFGCFLDFLDGRFKREMGLDDGQERAVAFGFDDLRAERFDEKLLDV